MKRLWCLVAYYSDGSGQPEVIFASNDEVVVDSVLKSIEAAGPMKRVVKVYPDAVLLNHNVESSGAPDQGPSPVIS